MSEKLLITGGIVISMDPAVGDLRPGDVLIEDGDITSVAPSIEAQGAQVIDASDMVVLPGLVDPHRHLWYGVQRGIAYDGGFPLFLKALWPLVGMKFGAADVYASTRGGIVDALNSGVTTVFDWCHVMNSPAHAEAAVRAHLESPLRCLFGFGPSMTRKQSGADGYSDWAQARTTATQTFAAHADRLRLALAIQGPESDPLEEARHDIEIARDIGVPVTMHIGMPQGQPRHGVRRLADEGLLGPDLQFVHCTGTTDEEFGLIAESDARFAVTPSCEVAIALGIPPTGRMGARGIPPAFGCDTVGAASGDQFDEARAGLLFERVLAQQPLYARGEEVVESAQLGFTALQALQAITINAARAMWMDDVVGSLTPGKRADVILLRATDPNLAPMNNVVETVVSCAHSGNVDTVMVAGKILKRGGRLTFVDLDELNAELAECRARIFAQSGYDGIQPPLGAAAR